MEVVKARMVSKKDRAQLGIAWKPHRGALFIGGNAKPSSSFCFSAARRLAGIVPPGTPALNRTCEWKGPSLRAAEKQKE
jgi:hypothetical protein